MITGEPVLFPVYKTLNIQKYIKYLDIDTHLHKEANA